MSDKIFYRVIDAKTGHVCRLYSSGFDNEGESDYPSIEAARNASFRGRFKDRARYKIAAYTSAEKLVSEDCDPATPEEIEAARIEDERQAKSDAEWEAEKLRRGIKPIEKTGGNTFATAGSFALEMGGRIYWEMNKRSPMRSLHHLNGL